MSFSDLRWQIDAACQGEGPALFFGPEDESPEDRDTRETAAKAVCAGCPVRWQCGSHAVTAGIRWGTWGGFGENELARVRRNYLRRQREAAA